MPTEKTIKLLQYLQEHPEKADGVNWDRVKTDSPDLKMDVVYERFNMEQPETMPTIEPQVPKSFATTPLPASTAVAPITQKKVGTLKPEDPVSTWAVLRNLGRSIGRFADPKTLSEGSKELLDQIGQADPFTSKGRRKLDKIITQFGEPLRDWVRVLTFYGSPGRIVPALPPESVKTSMRNIGIDPLAGPITAGMVYGGASGLSRLAGKLPKVGFRPPAKGKAPIAVKPKAKAPAAPAKEPPGAFELRAKRAVEAKEPWEYTKAEYTNQFKDRSFSHEQFISEALRKNKPVPAEVLKDYPDLAKPKAPPMVAKKTVGKLTAEQDAGIAALDDIAADLYKQKETALPTQQKAIDTQIREIGKQKEAVLRGEIETKPIEPVRAESTPTDIDVSVKKVTEALKEAKPIRKEQEALYTRERGARLAKLMAIREKTTGEAGFHAELGQLKGELPKVTFESIRKKVSQTDIDNLFNKVRDAEILTEWEKVTAREGLAKMFGEYGGRVPTEGQLALLDQVFPAGFMESVLANRPLWAKIKEGGLQLANIPRSIMASFDLSFGGRQGAFAAAKYRREFWNSWKKQFKEFGSEKAYQASREALVKDPEFLFAKESRVPFTEIGARMRLREERFASQWAEKIPLIGRGVRASGRAYTAFANRYRLDMFKSMVRDVEKAGFNPRKNRYMAGKMGDFVGNATGRGSLGSFENTALVLNAMFFSPRLNMARIRTLNPIYYIKQPKGVRKQAIQTTLAAAGLATTILTLAKLGGGEVEPDPRSADFGKIKIGNTRLDMLAGYGQFIRGGAQVITGQYISTTTGRKIDLGEGYRPLTRMDIIYRQIESKEAPIASFATGLLRDKNWAGEDFNVLKEAGNRFVPMVVADMIDIAKDDPKLLGLTAPAIFGIGLMTYPPRKKASWALGRGSRGGQGRR